MEKEILLNAELPFAYLSFDFLESYERFGPFGAGNPVPTFYARRVLPAYEPRLVKERHLQMDLVQNGTRAKAVWFGANHGNLPPPPWDIAFQLARNNFRGKLSLQLVIQDVKTHDTVWFA